jgi:hypothetical protein
MYHLAATVISTNMLVDCQDAGAMLTSSARSLENIKLKQGAKTWMV